MTMGRHWNVLTAVLLLLPVWTSARADIVWLEKEYNFGTFKEASGPVTGRVRFVNKGPEATFISRVRPSCGCTGASYTEKMIEPGDTAVVEFTYNPIGRPGKFDKTVKVYVGSENKLYVIRIAGTVIGSESTLESVFPHNGGDLRFETSRLLAGEVRRGSPRHVYLNVYNQSADTVTPSWSGASDVIAVDVAPKSIPPGETATFSFFLQTVNEKRNGPVEYHVGIYPAPGQKGDPFGVDVNAVVVADASAMSAEQIDNGPRAYLVPEFVDFGDVDKKGSLSFSFDILNDGKTDMKVDKVYSTSEFVKIDRRPKKVKAGRQSTVEGKLDIDGIPVGPFRIKVDVVTDDPLHPVRTANLVGDRK